MTEILSTIKMPETRRLERDADDLIKRVDSLEIVDEATVKRADEMLGTIAAFKKEIHSTFDPIVTAAYKAHRAAVDARRMHLAAFEMAENTLTAKLLTWNEKVEADRLAREQELRAQAQREAEEARLAEAEALESMGATPDEVTEVLEAPTEPAPIVLRDEKPKVQSSAGIRTAWKYRITNESAIPREYLMPNLKKIGQVVRAMKGDARIEGVEVYPEKQMSVRRSR